MASQSCVVERVRLIRARAAGSAFLLLLLWRRINDWTARHAYV